jgi:hypothetical protein
VYQGCGTLERMDSYACDECRAIHLELQEAFAAAKERLSDPKTTAQDLVAWVQQLTEDDCARMRETSSLWKTWRRLQAHRALTGHWLSLLPVLPNAIANPN